MNLSEFNQLTSTQCQSLLVEVCHSFRWAKMMSQGRPFATLSVLQDTAKEIWAQMSKDDILDAFSGHAKIGDLSALRDKYSAASAEQGQVADAQEEVLHDLMRLNQEYEKKNGFIFIVCATGKSAAQMRDMLLDRIDNSSEQELIAGAQEQAKITEIRLNKLFTTAQTTELAS